jgi:hypothetical protein
MTVLIKHGLGKVVLFAIAAITGAGCASVPTADQFPAGDRGSSLLRLSAQAQGYSALMKFNVVDVHLTGTWSPFIASIQPKLVDDQFRGSSDEHYWVHRPLVVQTDAGPGGIKQVVRDGAGVRVEYNNVPSTDPEADDAAALVADGYRMFLFGPAFFLERGGDARYAGGSCVDGMECDDVLVTLRPGIGRSTEDRVLVSIDRDLHFVRRVRMTVNGLASAAGGVGDIFLRDPIRIRGVVFPTTFYEELKAPVDLSVHHWRMTSIDFDQAELPTTMR